MRDFNFFSVYSEKTNTLLSRILVFTAFAILLAAIIGGSYFLLYLRLEGINAQIDEIDEFLNSDTVRDDQQTLTVLKGKLGIITRYSILTENIRLNLDSVDYFRVSVIEAIAAALPEGATLSDISSSGDQLFLSFEVDTVDTSAKLLYELEQLSCFSSVMPKNIALNEKTELYGYYVTAVMIGGAEK